MKRRLAINGNYYTFTQSYKIPIGYPFFGKNSSRKSPICREGLLMMLYLHRLI